MPIETRNTGYETIETWTPDIAAKPNGHDRKEVPLNHLAATMAAPARINERTVSAAIVDLMQHRVRYDHSKAAWFIWDGNCWKEDRTRLTFHSIVMAVVAATANLAPNKQKDFCSYRFCAAVERLMKVDDRVSITADMWNANPDLLGTPGGTIDLRSASIRLSDPAQMISKQTMVTPSFDPCPQWLAFLAESTRDDHEFISWLQTWIGYCLTGHTSENQLAFVHGDGGNGKGTFITTLTRLLGDYGLAAPMYLFIASESDRHSTDLAMLAGARFVTAQETKAGHAWNEERLKVLTGGDIITARFLYKDNFSFLPQFTLMMSGNHAPSLENVDEAIRRRINIIPFTNKPRTLDKELKQRLLDQEGAQILGWAIRGAKRWYEQGLTRSATVQAETSRYFGDQVPIEIWLAEECQIDAGSETQLEKLHVAYESYVKGEGRSMSRKAFSQYLVNKLGMKKRHGMYGTVIIGIKLNSPDLT